MYFTPFEHRKAQIAEAKKHQRQKTRASNCQPFMGHLTSGAIPLQLDRHSQRLLPRRETNIVLSSENHCRLISAVVGSETTP